MFEILMICVLALYIYHGLYIIIELVDFFKINIKTEMDGESCCKL